jgi:uncharacterized protein
VTGSDTFDWDAGNRDKCRKHGVSLAEIEAVLGGQPLVTPDPRHSPRETRFIALGRTAANRPIFIAFTLRLKGGRLLFRPISARYIHAKEIERYEAQSP